MMARNAAIGMVGCAKGENAMTQLSGFGSLAAIPEEKGWLSGTRESTQF
jgi:hypothetical protein